MKKKKPKSYDMSIRLYDFLFGVFLKANLWSDFIFSLNEFQIFAPLNLILNLP